MNLYQLEDEYLVVLESLSDIPDLTPEIIEDTLSPYKDAFEHKAINVAAYIKNLEGEEHQLKNHLIHMNVRHAALMNKIGALRRYLHNSLIAMKIDKIHDDLLDIIVKNNPPSVKIIDETQIPSTYFDKKEVITLDKRRLLELLKEGVRISGVQLIQNTRLDIK